LALLLQIHYPYKGGYTAMKIHKKHFIITIFALSMFFLFCQPVIAAISESDVQSQVDSLGKEAVSGNVLIWFLCAVAFLKVSQKIDSFMASLGVNVGHTGGNMLSEAIIAAKGITSAGNYFGGGHNNNSSHINANSNHSGNRSGFISGGLAGVVSRSVTNNAIKSATAHASAPSSGGAANTFKESSGGIGSHLYTSSVKKGGDFANNIIGSVATGSIAAMGSITGDKAAEALHSYMGFAALEEGAKDIPSFSNVEIGGGRIMGTETSPENPNGISFGMYHTEKYAAPDGKHTTIQAVDGSSWYKQYATDAVEKSPYMAPDGSIAYNESIVQKLPPPPRRKDKM